MRVGEFGGKENTALAKAKGELVEALPAGGVAILNADDPNVLPMAARTQAAVQTFSVSADRPADVRADAISLDDLGRASFGLIIRGRPARPVQPAAARRPPRRPTRLPRRRSLPSSGMDVPAIADALSQATARSKKRMELRERPDGVLVVNDAYNANPDSTRAAIEALAT